MARRTNSAVATGISTNAPSAATWAVLDALPPVVRRALHEAPVSINPASARDLITWHGYCPDDAAEALREASRAEVKAFAAQHHVRHGYELPHAAAGATLQPYAPHRQTVRQLSPSSSSSVTR